PRLLSPSAEIFASSWSLEQCAKCVGNALGLKIPLPEASKLDLLLLHSWFDHDSTFIILVAAPAFKAGVIVAKIASHAGPGLVNDANLKDATCGENPFQLHRHCSAASSATTDS